MRWGIVIAVTTIVVLIFLFERPRLKPDQKREKRSLVTLLVICWILSMFDLPNLPGPTTLIEFIFKPLVKLLES
jgi:multisubunit Na+/H+ antiporter MnhB subunit